MLSPFLTVAPTPATPLIPPEAVDGVLMTGMRNVTENFAPLLCTSYFPAVCSALQQVLMGRGAWFRGGYKKGVRGMHCSIHGHAAGMHN